MSFGDIRAKQVKQNYCNNNFRMDNIFRLIPG